MRLSSTQKDILLLLYAIENNGNQKPVPNMLILNMINRERGLAIEGSNFRASCHKLNENNMINRYRSTSLKLAWLLTDEGREKARVIFNERIA